MKVNILTNPVPKGQYSAQGCWPTNAQSLLLHAALADYSQALSSWRKWNEIVDLEQDHIDVGSYRLLPLVYKRLLQDQIDEPHTQRLQGLYKRTWYENQVRFRVHASILEALHEAGVNTLLLSGIALSVQYYGDLGSRPMGQIEILIPRNNVLNAVEVIIELGWIRKSDIDLSEDLLDIRCGLDFRSSDGLELDLRWDVFDQCLNEQSTAQFWDACVPIGINGVNSRALNPTDQFLRLCVQGPTWKKVPSVRWAADAWLIMNAANIELDWYRLLALSISCGCSQKIHAALKYLEFQFQLDIPERVFTGLESVNTTYAQNARFIALTHGGRWRNTRLVLSKYLLNERYCNKQISLSDFIEYLRLSIGKDNAWQVVQWGIVKTTANSFSQLRSFLKHLLETPK